MVIYEIYGNPTPWAAPQKSGNRFYSPKSKEKEQAIWQVKAKKNHPTFTGALRVDIIFYRSIPKSTSGIRRKQMLSGLIYPICKPDRSNMLKFAEDVLQGAGVIANDSQIVQGETRKLYGLEAKTVIHIQELSEMDKANTCGSS